jgi:CRISPR-associated protein Csb2
MRLILCQSFPLGRFHATPWRVNPYDDPAGEWPPSPWRFVRAVVARWYQWSRETSDTPDLAQLDALVRALCDSAYSFHLPVQARRGSSLRQYHPVEFGWAPPPKKGKFISRMRAYGTSLVQDNFWSLPRGDGGAVWWFLEGDHWNPELVEVLDRCLERLIYFGRAEALTAIRRVEGSAPEPNCEPGQQPRSPRSVRVLFPQPDATRADVERITDDPDAARRTVAPGAKLMYADLPSRVPAREQPFIFSPPPECRLIQLAIGWNFAPEPRTTVRLTARFRSAVLRELLIKPWPMCDMERCSGIIADGDHRHGR